jgi:Transposase DDE domain
MEHQLWQEIVALMRRFGKQAFSPHRKHEDRRIVETWFWAVLHDRPMSWACCRENWPKGKRCQELPSSATMSRRLRTASVRRLLWRVEQEVLAPHGCPLQWFVDGKPLMISGCSKDRQAGYGRAARCKAKGYKLHTITANDGALAAWRVAPMNIDERVMAERMLRVANIHGYVIGDSNYDSNVLHKVCDERGNLQLVTRRRYGSKHGHGHRRQTCGRLRSKALLENPYPAFGESLLRQRAQIERFYARLTNWGGGLTHLPPWVRTHRRVHRWIQAKLILAALRQRLRKTTYVAR